MQVGAAPTDCAGLYRSYAPGKFGLNDRAYLAGIHPLELWLLAYRQAHLEATRADVMRDSAAARQEADAWLMKPDRRAAQHKRIEILAEEDAFKHILADWKRQGYPFDKIVPSLSTAIGSSGDRPDALGALMGIVLNGGLRQPTVDIEKLQFAAGTPYETELFPRPAPPVRIMSSEEAAVIRRALGDVVDHGTALRVKGAYRTGDGALLSIGGKTGTGDNRIDTYAAGGRILSSRPVDRTATFVFFLGDRLYGTITAYVRGADAGRYDFTSALAVSVLKDLEAEIRPLLKDAAPRSMASRT
jgi:membrane peptidoglycan carboxypeptidase